MTFNVMPCLKCGQRHQATKGEAEGHAVTALSPCPPRDSASTATSGGVWSSGECGHTREYHRQYGCPVIGINLDTGL